MRKIQARRHRLQHSLVEQEPMELDRISSEDSDENMSDPEPLTWERPGSLSAAPQVEAVPPSSTIVHLESLEHGTAASVSEDGERISPADWTADSSMPRQRGLDDADDSSQHTRISLEQEQLEKRLERERLEEELNLSRQEPLSRRGQTPITETGIKLTDVTQDRSPASRPRPDDSSIRSHSPPADIIARVEETLPSGHVDITFWSHERDDWRLSDHLQVDPSDP
ncbi:hypothetical protein BDW60DRAFT_43154 [Aspergillus nidulans var. acristatus]